MGCVAPVLMGKWQGSRKSLGCQTLSIASIQKIWQQCLSMENGVLWRRLLIARRMQTQEKWQSLSTVDKAGMRNQASEMRETQ